MTVGERIRQRRLELELTQEELAKRLGYASRSSVNKMEVARDLPLKKVEAMASALMVTPAYLMGWEEESTSPGMILYLEDIKNKLYVDEITEYIRKLNDTGKAEAVERVKELTFNPRYSVVKESILNAAHERTDIKVTDAMRKHDDDIMDDDDF